MAFASTKTYFNVKGKLRENIYTNVTLNNGDSLTTPINSVVSVVPSPATNFTSWTVVSNGQGGGSTITFTLSAPVTGTGTTITISGN